LIIDRILTTLKFKIFIPYSLDYAKEERVHSLRIFIKNVF